ncbi:MAG: DUF3793 family protein [Brotaphodocola sp.]
MSLEKYLVEYCAPTLASLKTANLFSLAITDEQEFMIQLGCVNRWLSKKGLLLTELRRRGDRALIYVCRKSHLQRDLERAEIRTFLQNYGYTDLTLEAALERLRIRLAECENFPHEIGVFLGYPLEDVVGFIRNEGKNCKCSGIWKVYSDENEAKKLFALFLRCKDVYMKLWDQGRPIWSLTVMA